MGPEVRTGINETIPDPEMDTRFRYSARVPLSGPMSGRPAVFRGVRPVECHVAKFMNW